MAGKRKTKLDRAHALEVEAAELRARAASGKDRGGTPIKRARLLERQAAELRSKAGLGDIVTTVKSDSVADSAAEDVSGDFDADTAISRRVKETLAKWGLSVEVERCLRGIIESTSVAQVEVWQAKLDGMKTVMNMYKTVADTEKRSSEIVAAEGGGFDEVQITLNR